VARREPELFQFSHVRLEDGAVAIEVLHEFGRGDAWMLPYQREHLPGPRPLRLNLSMRASRAFSSSTEYDGRGSFPSPAKWKRTR